MGIIMITGCSNGQVEKKKQVQMIRHKIKQTRLKLIIFRMNRKSHLK